MQKPLKLALITFAISMSSSLCLAIDMNSSGIKTGLVSANYTGASIATGSFITLMSIEAEAILVQKERQNFVFTSTIALDAKETRTRYFFAGIGQRYFLNGVSQRQLGAFGQSFVDYSPHTLWYAGWDAGFSQMLLIPFGDVLASYSTMAEAGLSFGMRKSLSKSLSVDGRIAGAMGTGISNNPVTSQVFRALIGVVYFF